MGRVTLHKDDSNQDSTWHVFLVFLHLGLTAFGGPIAHLGYFRDEFVIRRRWLSERSYADLVALCQFLPGPASSQVGIALGLSRKGYLGALAAWAGFTLPSAAILIAFALLLKTYDTQMPSGVVHGLKIVAVAVVAQAVLSMAKNLKAGFGQIIILAIATGTALLIPTAIGQLGIIMAGALVGLVAFKPHLISEHEALTVHISHSTGIFFLWLFFGFLFGLPFLIEYSTSQIIYDINAFYRSGSLVFGGGHVVLPLLQASVVPQGLVDNNTFLAGYGVAQAIPGPLFTFAAFLGASMNTPPSGWLGGFICLIAIFAPSFLLVMGALPFWERLRSNQKMQSALLGINAAVVGLLLAAFINPVLTSSITELKDIVIAGIALIALTRWKAPPWLVVIVCGLAGLIETLI